MELNRQGDDTLNEEPLFVGNTDNFAKHKECTVTNLQELGTKTDKWKITKEVEQKEEEDCMEVTSSGAAGQLTDAEDSAYQEP